MPGPARRWAGRPPPKPSTSSYCYSNKAVLRRPLEPGHVTPDEMAHPLPVAFGERTVQLQLMPAGLDDVSRYRGIAAPQLAERIPGVRDHCEDQHRRQQQDRDRCQEATDSEARHANSQRGLSEGTTTSPGITKTN